MGRAPCCEKMGLKRGPWTPEEDLILINYINTYGHNNWRALPKQAGLLRCGKSCRLRWINYLRPDIKRGNFTMEEEDTIIKLHEMMGNRWSAIAARLPGRTDNEIKNVWHTHLKKRLQQDTTKPISKQILLFHTKNPNNQDPKQQEPVNIPNTHNNNVNIKIERTEEERPLSPPQCSSSDDISILTTITTNHDLSLINNNNNFSVDESIDGGDNLALDEDFWSEVLSSDNSNVGARNFQDIIISDDDELKFQFPFSSLVSEEEGVHFATSSLGLSDGMEFWYDVYTKAEELLPQL